MTMLGSVDDWERNDEMSGDNPRRTEEEWERIFRMKRSIETLMEQHTLADVMAREKSPYLLSDQAAGANRAERRRQDARARKSRP